MLIRVWPMPGPVSAQSVMWRPGKMRFLIGMKKPASYSAGRDRQTTSPLAGSRSPDSRLQSGYALLPSRIRRHSLILFAAAHCGSRRQLRTAHCTASPGLLILRQER